MIRPRLQTFDVLIKNSQGEVVSCQPGLTEMQAAAMLRHELYIWTAMRGYTAERVNNGYWKLTKTTGRWLFKRTKRYALLIDAVPVSKN